MISKFTGKSAKQLVAEHADVDERERAAVRAAVATRAVRNATEVAS